MWVECAACGSVQPDVVWYVKTPFCFESQRHCGSVRKCGADTVKDDTNAQVKDVTTSKMAIELPPEEQVKGGGNGVIIDTVVLSLVHGHQQSCVVESVSYVGLCTEMTSISRGPNDGDDKTVTILNRLVTWVDLSGSRNQIEIDADPRNGEILLAQMNLDGANVKSVTTPAIKMQERTPQMLTKIDNDRASKFRSATMRASYMSINRVDVVVVGKEEEGRGRRRVARFMTEPSKGAWIMLKRLVRYLVGYGRLVQVISEQRYVKAPHAWTLTAITWDVCLPGRARRVHRFCWVPEA